MQKLNDELYQRFHGLKPVKRNKKKQGQSDWYYVDPRYDDERGQIDVANENEPNPQLAEILVDDIKKNPDNYYIWRTKGDDKVRSHHKEREGKIFNKHIPPEGGHPGEDYNCRCWAEPYKATQTKEDKIVDVSGLEENKENKENIDNKDKVLYDKAWENVKEFEKFIEHPYLDTNGNITIGVGANVHDWKDFRKLNVTVNELPATEEQKWKAYSDLRKMSEEKDEKGEYKNHDTAAESFKDKTNIRISFAEAEKMARQHIVNDLKYLRKKIKDFDDFPEPLQDILLDIQYNVGSLSEEKWPNLYKAIRNKDVDGIAANVNRQDIHKDRNDWAKKQALSIRF